MRRLANKISLAMEERKRLRRRSPLSIAIADRFSQLSAEGWRAATDGASVFHSAAYQRMLERVRPPNVEMSASISLARRLSNAKTVRP